MTIIAIFHFITAFDNKPFTMTVVEFFFDIVSPFSVFQHELLQRQLGHWKSMELKLTPVYIRKIFEASQNAPPGLNPAKGIYLFSDLKICSEFYKVSKKSFTYTKPLLT